MLREAKCRPSPPASSRPGPGGACVAIQLGGSRAWSCSLWPGDCDEERELNLKLLFLDHLAGRVASAAPRTAARSRCSSGRSVDSTESPTPGGRRGSRRTVRAPSGVAGCEPRPGRRRPGASRGSGLATGGGLQDDALPALVRLADLAADSKTRRHLLSRRCKRRRGPTRPGVSGRLSPTSRDGDRGRPSPG